MLLSDWLTTILFSADACLDTREPIRAERGRGCCTICWAKLVSWTTTLH